MNKGNTTSALEKAEKVLELTGCSNLTELGEWFKNMDYSEILLGCNDCWPSEDNDNLARDISDIMSNLWYLREFHAEMFA